MAERERPRLSLAMPNLGTHATLFLTEFPTALATFLDTHALHVSSRVRSHSPLTRRELGEENLVRAIGGELWIVESRRRDSSPIAAGDCYGMIACFPTYARQRPGGDSWRVNAAGMLARPLPESSRRRSVGLAVFRRLLEIEPGHENDPIFQTRVGGFLCQRVVGCRVLLQIGTQSIEAGASDRLGHFETSFDLAAADLASSAKAAGGWLDYRATLDASDVLERHLGGSAPVESGTLPNALGGSLQNTGRVQCIPPEGLSVISDIDDTVKLTNVGDRRELLANTFLRQFRPVPGMVDLFREWHAAGTAFHYVSASPWQLAGCLAGFFEDAGLPPGSMHLSLFRLKDTTPLGRLPSKKRSKRRSIERILEDFPGRRFVLVGDSGEKDPEIYTAVARRFPQQVSAIAIREVNGKPRAKSLAERLPRLRRRLPEGLLQPFRETEELAAIYAAATR